jgi:light-regulated signal transduction histidine kinase (bacteriophytochrome)
MEATTEKILFDVGRRFEGLLRGKIPGRLKVGDYESEIERDFAGVANKLIDSFEEVHRFIIPLSQGRLEDFASKKNNYLASPFKELHSRLKHLTWQSRQVAAGDFSQRVEFMGEFSEAFNSMVEGLAERERQLREAKMHLEEKVAERTLELRRTVEKLDSYNKQLEEFIYIATHDLKEPLRRVTAFGQMLEKSLEGKLNAEDRENFELMTEGATRMLEMVRALRSYSEISRNDKDDEAVDLNKVIERIKKYELSSIIEDSGGELIVPEHLHIVRGEQRLVKDLLLHLITNGLNYHKKAQKSTVTIRSEKLDNGMVLVKVEDNGIGMKREQLSQIFRLFKRLNLRKEYPGIGAGLALCRKIVELHGGSIDVNSVFGKGSTFRFTLPAGE